MAQDEMVGTPQILPEDALIGLPKGPRFADPAMWCVAVLRKFWEETATLGTMPRIDLRSDVKGFDFRDQPQIVVYNMPSRMEIATIDNDYKHEYDTVTLDFWTAHPAGVNYLVRMVRESERIINENRREPFTEGNIDGDVSGRQWLLFGSRVIPFDKNTNGLWRKTVEVQFNWKFRRIKDAEPMC